LKKSLLLHGKEVNLELPTSHKFYVKEYGAKAYANKKWSPISTYSRRSIPERV